MNKCKILISTSCRSDSALIEPIVEKLEKGEWCEVNRVNLVPGNYEISYFRVNTHLTMNTPDLVIIVGDRLEQMAYCQCAFLHNIPIAIYGSGITNTIATHDDIHRHNMCLMAEICLCEDKTSLETTVRLRTQIDKFDGICEIVGNLYLEGLTDIDESLVPDEPYDLFLLNPETIFSGNSEFQVPEHNRRVLIGPNPDDPDFGYHERFENDIYYDNLPRPQFLGLLSKCRHFISNSSLLYYEAPYFLDDKQIIQVGSRNRGRSTPTEWLQDYKTSDKIVEILKEWWSKNE